MKMIQEQIKSDMLNALKIGDLQLLRSLKIITGELQRSKHKELIDGEVVGILKALLKNEKATEGMTAAQKLRYESYMDTYFYDVVRSYLPKQIDETTIRQWIVDNVDFSILRNKMQAVGMVVKEFGKENIDGGLVKSVVMSIGD